MGDREFATSLSLQHRVPSRTQMPLVPPSQTGSVQSVEASGARDCHFVEQDYLTISCRLTSAHFIDALHMNRTCWFLIKSYCWKAHARVSQITLWLLSKCDTFLSQQKDTWDKERVGYRGDTGRQNTREEDDARFKMCDIWILLRTLSYVWDRSLKGRNRLMMNGRTKSQRSRGSWNRNVNLYI